ncbi:MAG: EAL domain-containing protein [Rhodospirillales bacterium]|jgi:EAL domain-containing protein (putative c-di-GMP-specific phosphodiesterase class I)|nr:EAL domain-containing protein [Rhodospirillales bacterium]
MAETEASVARPRNGTISEEGLLLDHLRRIERTRAGCCVVHFHLSGLQASYRKPNFVRIAARVFDNLINSNDVTQYALSNCDLVLICRNVRVEDIDTAVFKLRSLFAEDPLVSDAFGETEDRFASWYDLAESTDYASFEEVALDLETETQQRLGPRAINRANLAPLDVTALIQIERRLQKLRLSEYIRHQPAIDVRPGAGKQIMFFEHYVSMADLARKIAPDVDLFSNPWLFHFITDFLDRRVLAVVGRMNFDKLADPLSLNLHIGTVLSPEFQLFNDQVKSQAEKIIIEVQMIDVIADMGAYDYARKWLADQGYRLLIDGLSPLTLQFFDPGIIEPDYIKIAWSADMIRDIADTQMEELRDVVGYFGADKIVLARVEAEEAVKWGLGLGIHRFQGYFVDKLADAMSAKGLI